MLDAVGTRGHRSVDTIRWRLADDERLTGLGRSLAAAGLLRRRTLRGREAWSPTRAGRHALRRLAAQPPVDRALDGGSALLVALTGREAMPDADLRAAIFERPALPRGARAPDRPSAPGMRAGSDSDDPAVAAYQTRNALGGAAGIGFIGGGGAGGRRRRDWPPRSALRGRPATSAATRRSSADRAALTSSGFSSRTMCPASGTTTYSASGSRSTISSLCAFGIILSASPVSTSVGTRRSGSSDPVSSRPASAG